MIALITLLALCHQLVTTDLLSEEGLSGHLDHGDVALDKLVTRLHALAERLDKVMENREETERVAVGLDRMLDDELGTSTNGCPKGMVSCGEGSAQCIPPYLLCDGVAECKNGFDEDPSLCVMPFKTGDKFVGRSLQDDCVAGLPAGSNVTMTLVAVEHSVLLKSNVQAFVLMLIESPIIIGVGTSALTYSYATKRLDYDYTGIGNTRRIGFCYQDRLNPDFVHCRSRRRDQGVEDHFCFHAFYKLVRDTK